MQLRHEWVSRGSWCMDGSNPPKTSGCSPMASWGWLVQLEDAQSIFAKSHASKWLGPEPLKLWWLLANDFFQTILWIGDRKFNLFCQLWEKRFKMFTWHFFKARSLSIGTMLGPKRGGPEFKMSDNSREFPMCLQSVQCDFGPVWSARHLRPFLAAVMAATWPSASIPTRLDAIQYHEVCAASCSDAKQHETAQSQQEAPCCHLYNMMNSLLAFLQLDCVFPYCCYNAILVHLELQMWCPKDSGGFQDKRNYQCLLVAVVKLEQFAISHQTSKHIHVLSQQAV